MRLIHTTTVPLNTLGSPPLFLLVVKCIEVLMNHNCCLYCCPWLAYVGELAIDDNSFQVKVQPSSIVPTLLDAQGSEMLQ